MIDPPIKVETVSNINITRSIFGKTFWVLILLGFAISLITYNYTYNWQVWIAGEWVIGIFICLGFALPNIHNRKVRIKRAEISKLTEMSKWGFHSRDREGPWLNFISEPVIITVIQTKGMRFYSEWLIIHDGLIIVNPGSSSISDNGDVYYNFSDNYTYSWDGCSPKVWFYWIALFGTPDWGHCTIKYRTFDTSSNDIKFKEVEEFWQKAHLASLVHDALYQYLDSIPLSKYEVDRLFYVLLLEIGFSKPVAGVYYFFVRRFGGIDTIDNQHINTRYSTNLERIISMNDLITQP